VKAALSQVEARRRRALSALAAVLLCEVVGVAYAVGSRLAVPGSLAATGTLSGRVVVGESNDLGTAELQPGQSLVQAVQQRDVVETVDLGRGTTYEFRLLPGLYTLRIGAELPGNDDFCAQEVRIKARQVRRANIRCTPIEHASLSFTNVSD
jgi:hypothetical protein